MNLLELQQRANLLVEKANNYEASLANVEWDEQDVINQHKYTDLYSLRPVLKLLFGSSISEKTNRTLDNDTALRVFASSAPMWNSSFNLLSYTPGASVYQPSSFSVDYKSDQHEFMNDIHNYNQNNLITLDAKQNLLTDRNTRIKQGINYGYAANIQDALVTESQVANIFKWNTTTDETVQNNIITINRQVPGIVCYYLGNDYTGDYTATIPYNPGLSKLNQINYSTPPSYGAFYTTDQSTSQVPVWTGVLEENKGHEACRIFIPGMHYTRGKLESPQQIWQPDIKFGSSNDNLGYNWQGQALYHELVFKNRRSGAGDQNVDFIPTPATVADNDPQGLATRFALAKQKEFYKNRPWFNELDVLSEMDASKLVKIIENNSYITNDNGSFDKSKFTIATGGELDDNGILNDCSKQVKVTGLNILLIDELTIYGPKITFEFDSTNNTQSNDNQFIAREGFDNSVSCALGKLYFDSASNMLQVNSSTKDSYPNATPSGTYQIKIKLKRINDQIQSTFQFINTSDDSIWKENIITNTPTNGSFNIQELFIANDKLKTGESSKVYDLSTIKIIDQDDNILFSARTESSRRYMTDSEFYNQFKLDYNMYAKAFTQPE